MTALFTSDCLCGGVGDGQNLNEHSHKSLLNEQNEAELLCRLTHQLPELVYQLSSSVLV